jgi:8-oxo-dGTP pyrophosphatase MutT (NUDIX family)
MKKQWIKLMNTLNYTELIKRSLGARKPKVIANGDLSYRHAGVLIPLLVENDILKVLFTKRTDIVEHHKGQISFPGGAVDEQDASLEDTVLRETEEEIGVKMEDVALLGRIDDTLTMASRFIVHPFVGQIPSAYAFKINDAEVKRIIKVPLSAFDPENSKEYRKHAVTLGGTTSMEPAYEYYDDVIWGATGRMMKNFIEIIDGL